MGWSADKSDAVAHAIMAHSYSAGIEPRSIEARILRDADRLDALGAIGIARTFAVSGRLGRPLYDVTDPEAMRRPLDDASYALDHFAAKLLKLEDGMLTETGRYLAKQRTEFMRQFLATFLGEVGPSDLSS